MSELLDLVDLDSSPPLMRSSMYRSAGSTPLPTPSRGRPLSRARPTAFPSAPSATHFPSSSALKTPVAESSTAISAPSAGGPLSRSELDMFLNLALLHGQPGTSKLVAGTSSRTSTSNASRNASPSHSSIGATAGSPSHSVYTISSEGSTLVSGPPAYHHSRSGSPAQPPSKIQKLSSAKPPLGKRFGVGPAGGSTKQPSTSDFLNSAIQDVGLTEGSSNPLRSLAMWANNLQVLYATFEGIPLTLAQVIALRRSGKGHSIQRFDLGLLNLPKNPLGTCPIKPGLSVAEACNLAEVPLVTYNNTFKTPEISKSTAQLDGLQALTLLYEKLGSNPTEALESAKTDIEDTGFPNFDNLVDPTFSQNCDNRPYEKYIWSILVVVTCIKTTNTCLLNEQRLIREFLTKSVPICEGFFCGSGSLRGQIGRIAKGYEVSKSVQPNGLFYSDFTDTLDDDELLRGLHLVMPYPHCGIVSGSVEPSVYLTETVAKVTVEHGEIADYPLYVVNSSAHSGPPWNGKTLKVNTLLQDLCLTIDFVNSVGDGTDEDGLPTSSDYDDLIKLVHIKSKSEVQNFHENFYLKNRNIFPANVVTANLFSSFQRMCHRRVYNFINHPTSKLLAGIPLCTTGMGSVLEKILDELSSSGKSVTFYADNIHICESNNRSKAVYCSIDLSSEESRHDERTASLAIKHILRDSYNATLMTNSNVDKVVSVTAMSSNFANILLTFGPKMLVNCIGILGNREIPLPGLPSGCPLTFDINSCATAPAICDLLACDNRLLTDTGEPSLDTHNIMVRYRLPYKVEFKSGLDEHGNSEFEKRYNKCFEIGREGSIIPLDMLGFDAVILKVSDPDKPRDPLFMTFGVLNEERFLKMFWFNKSAWSDYKDVANRLIILRNRLMKFCVAYLTLGGFLPSRSSATLAIISNTAYSITQILGPNVDPTAILGLGKEDSDETLLQTIEELGLRKDSMLMVNNAVREAVRTGHINFGSVIKITQGDAVLERVISISNRYPHHFPPGLLNFDALSEDFVLGESNINSPLVEFI